MKTPSLSQEFRNDLRYDNAFRANPNNINHTTYQRSVDRWFMILLVSFVSTVGLLAMPYTIAEALAALVLAVGVAALATGAVFGIILVLLWCIELITWATSGR